MRAGKRIQIELIRLMSGERVLRLSDTKSGLSLERKLDPKLPVVRQKEQLLDAFEAALARAQLAPA